MRQREPVPELRKEQSSDDALHIAVRASILQRKGRVATTCVQNAFSHGCAKLGHRILVLVLQYFVESLVSSRNGCIGRLGLFDQDHR